MSLFPVEGGEKDARSARKKTRAPAKYHRRKTKGLPPGDEMLTRNKD